MMVETKLVIAALAGMVGFDAISLLGAADAGAVVSLAGAEKLGVAAVLVAVLLWLLREERADRLAAQAELRRLEASVREALIPIVDRHTAVLQQSVEAHHELTRVISKALDS
jgi:hypothetical protein